MKKKKRKEEIKGQKKIYIKYECFWEREKKKKRNKKKQRKKIEERLKKKEKNYIYILLEKEKNINLIEEDLWKSKIKRKKWKEKKKLDKYLNFLKKIYKKKGIKEDLYNYIMDNNWNFLNIIKRRNAIENVLFRTDKRFLELFYYLHWKNSKKKKKKKTQEEKLWEIWEQKIQEQQDWNEKWYLENDLEFLKWEDKFYNNFKDFYKWIYWELHKNLWKNKALNNIQKELLINKWHIQKIYDIKLQWCYNLLKLLINTNISNVVIRNTKLKDIINNLKQINLYCFLKIWEIIILTQIKERNPYNIDDRIADNLLKIDKFYNNFVEKKILEEDLVFEENIFIKENTIGINFFLLPEIMEKEIIEAELSNEEIIEEDLLAKREIFQPHVLEKRIVTKKILIDEIIDERLEKEKKEKEKIEGKIEEKKVEEKAKQVEDVKQETFDEALERKKREKVEKERLEKERLEKREKIKKEILEKEILERKKNIEKKKKYQEEILLIEPLLDLEINLQIENINFLKEILKEQSLDDKKIWIEKKEKTISEKKEEVENFFIIKKYIKNIEDASLLKLINKQEKKISKKEEKFWKIWEEKILIQEKLNIFWEKNNWKDLREYNYQVWEDQEQLNEKLEEQWKKEYALKRKQLQRHITITWLVDHLVVEYMHIKIKGIIQRLKKLYPILNYNNYIKKQLKKYIKKYIKEEELILNKIEITKKQYDKYKEDKEQEKIALIAKLPSEQREYYKKVKERRKKLTIKEKELEHEKEELDEIQNFTYQNIYKKKTNNKIQVKNWIKEQYKEVKKEVKKEIKKKVKKKKKKETKREKYEWFWKKKKKYIKEKKKTIKKYKYFTKEYWSIIMKKRKQLEDNKEDALLYPSLVSTKDLEKTLKNTTAADFIKQRFTHDKLYYANEEERKWRLKLALWEDIMDKMRNNEYANYKWYLKYRFDQEVWELEDWYVYKKWIKIKWKKWENDRKLWTLQKWKNWETEKYVFFTMLCNLWQMDRTTILRKVEDKYEIHLGDIFLKVWDYWQFKRIAYIAWKMLKLLYKKKNRKIRTQLQMMNEFRLKKFK